MLRRATALKRICDRQRVQNATPANAHFLYYYFTTNARFLKHRFTTNAHFLQDYIL